MTMTSRSEGKIIHSNILNLVNNSSGLRFHIGELDIDL